MKGIVLAGGAGTRLHPMTLAVSKQLIPVYNKPMIYYPLSMLLKAGIRDILIITTREDQSQFQRLLQDGSQFGVSFSYAIQEEPKGLAEAFIIGKSFVGNQRVALILGDNIFYGQGMNTLLKNAAGQKQGASLFGYEVKDPERYGVAEINGEGKLISIEEKPKTPKSNIAVTGLYFYSPDVLSIAESLKPSHRGELEITDINRIYMERGEAEVHVMGRGYAWLDAGTYESLMQSSQFVQVIEERQGHFIAALEEIAFDEGFIDVSILEKQAKKLGKSPYGNYLMSLCNRGKK